MLVMPDRDLFAEHAALAAAIRAKDDARQPRIDAARARLDTARAAEEATWQATEAARQAWNADRHSPVLTQAVAVVDDAYAEASGVAHAAYQAMSALLAEVLDESGRDLAQLLALGDQARAEQDVWFASTGAREVSHG